VSGLLEGRRAIVTGAASPRGLGLATAMLMAEQLLARGIKVIDLSADFRLKDAQEWSRWYGAPTGCTVHLVDPGIDTGDIVCCRAVSTAEARSIFELRQIIDAAQIALLGEVVEYVVTTGELPARRSQQAGEGRQYFAMHPEVRQLLEQSLAGS